MVNAPDCGSGIRGFDSHQSPHFYLGLSIKNFIIVAVVAKWLTHLIVVQAFVGSIPISRPIIYKL